MEAQATIAELILMDSLPAARVTCAPRLIPGPGQYLLALAEGSAAPLATVLFAATLEPDGFVAAPPLPDAWRPGTHLSLRGPLGRGFILPPAARRIALIACDSESRRLLPLLDPAFRQGASVTLVCDRPPQDLPLQVELQPSSAVADVCNWSDYAALDVDRQSLPALLARLGDGRRPTPMGRAQALVHTPMPCGGLAKCGVCTVKSRRGPQLACEDGPVFDFDSLVVERQ